jgi:hypothetical protein
MRNRPHLAPALHENTEESALVVHFDHSKREKLQKYARATERELFYYLINADEYPDVLPTAFSFTRDMLHATQQDTNIARIFQFFPYSPDELQQRLDIIRNSRQRYQVGKLRRTLNEDQCIYTLTQYAPTDFVDGCLLQNISKAPTCHTEPFAQLFCVYLDKLGLGGTASNTASAYRSLLRAFSISVPEVTSRLFVDQSRLVDSAFTAPVFQLSISQFPRTFLPEIIGFNLGHSWHVSKLLDFLPFASIDIDLPFPESTRIVYQRHARVAKEVVDSYLQQIEKTRDQRTADLHWRRIWMGVRAQRTAESRLVDHLDHHLGTLNDLSPRDKVLDIFKQKIPYARGHHRNVKLGDKDLDAWFGEDSAGLTALLDRLAHSSYVDVDRPDQSTFITELLAFDGPMYKVFNKSEIDAILAWVRSLNDSTDPNQAKTMGANSNYCPDPSSQSPTEAHLHLDEEPLIHPTYGELFASSTKSNYCRKQKGAIFYYLINADLYPDILPMAKKLARTRLHASKPTFRRLTLAPELKFFTYSHQAFEQRISFIYERAVNSYQPFNPPPRFSKAEYAWMIEQLAPVALVDGCWLQNIATLNSAYGEVASRLFNIYADEVGNGDPSHNHANVYRDLLKSAGIELPDTASYEFIRHPGFSNSCFELPNYLLAISQFPRAFLPELIGLNLAIELSGLGGFYLSLADEMRYWHLDHRFVALHNSIDNLANGHAAIARDVVHLHLDHVLAIHGKDEMQRQWKRVWTGYVSLTRVSKKMWMALFLRFVVKFGAKRCRNALATLLPQTRSS